MPDIINVIVDDTFTPPGFNPDLVTFDADNIYVNLKGSACLLEGRLVSESKPVIPACANPTTPTGFNNRITLTIEFAAEGTIDDATIDQLYDWRELRYPKLFPTHQDSMYIHGYYARFYEGTGFYMGSLRGRLYLYHIHLGVMIEIGDISHLVEEMQKEMNMVVHQMPTDETDNK